jgi:hypothetical protein
MNRLIACVHVRNTLGHTAAAAAETTTAVCVCVQVTSEEEIKWAVDAGAAIIAVTGQKV